MSPAIRLAAGALVVAAAFSGGSLAGEAVGPVDVGAPGPHQTASRGSDVAGPVPGAGEQESAGLSISEAGYTLQADTTTFTGAGGEVFTFRILGRDGSVVEAFEPTHERELHLVLVSRNLLVYFHLHPDRGPDGTWSIALPVLPPALYRAFASFAVAGGPELTLSVDLLVPGTMLFLPLPETGDVAPADNHTVTVAGTPVVGAGTELAFTITRDGAPVTDLEPYLGALGHLVAIRAGDLAYSHVHPVDDPFRGGPTVRFLVEFTAPGDYRLFLDFAHGGGAHTAAFTVHVPVGPAAELSTSTIPAAGAPGLGPGGTTAPTVEEG